MVRLIEAAPTWSSDRAQGARVLLLAIAAGSLPGSQSQRLSWTWKLARASRETQYRAATAASPAIRDLLRTLASSRGEEHHVRARLLVASLRSAELPVQAAALAAALTHDAIAARTIEMARDDLGSDVELLAAAFATNLPEQKPDPPAKARRARKKRKGDRPAGAASAQASANGRAANGKAPEKPKEPVAATETAEGPATPPAEGAPARKRRRRRRRRKGTGEAGAPTAQANGAPVNATAAPETASTHEQKVAEALKTAQTPKPARKPKAQASKGAEGDEASNGDDPAAKAKPRPRRRKRAVMDAASIGLPPKKGEDG